MLVTALRITPLLYPLCTTLFSVRLSLSFSLYLYVPPLSHLGMAACHPLNSRTSFMSPHNTAI